MENPSLFDKAVVIASLSLLCWAPILLGFALYRG